jgi:hypothetical protein
MNLRADYILEWFTVVHFRIFSSDLVSNDIKIKIHQTIILPVVLHVCKTWTLALMEEHTLRVFQIRMLRNMVGPGRQKVTEAGKNYTGCFTTLGHNYRR